MYLILIISHFYKIKYYFFSLDINILSLQISISTSEIYIFNFQNFDENYTIINEKKLYIFYQIDIYFF
jgi:hypothetical protein